MGRPRSGVRVSLVNHANTSPGERGFIIHGICIDGMQTHYESLVFLLIPPPPPQVSVKWLQNLIRNDAPLRPLLRTPKKPTMMTTMKKRGLWPLGWPLHGIHQESGPAASRPQGRSQRNRMAPEMVPVPLPLKYNNQYPAPTVA